MDASLVAGLLPVVIFCFSYATYCIYHGGCFIEHKGWKTKEEWPKTYWCNIVILLALGLISLFVLLIIMIPIETDLDFPRAFKLR